MRSLRTLHLILPLILVGCGGDDDRREISSRAEEATPAPPVASWHDHDLIAIPEPEGERKVGVRLSEYQIEMTTERAPAGEIEFHIVNAGTTIHYLLVRSDSVYAPSPHLPPGDSAVLRVNLASGEYQYLCTIRDEFDHYSEGMRGTFVVY